MQVKTCIIYIFVAIVKILLYWFYFKNYFLFITVIAGLTRNPPASELEFLGLVKL